MLKRLSHAQTRFLLNHMGEKIHGVYKPTDLPHGSSFLMSTGCKLFSTLCGSRKSYYLSGYGNGHDVERLVQALEQKDPVTGYVVHTLTSHGQFESVESKNDLGETTKFCYRLHETGRFKTVDLYERRLIQGVTKIAQWLYE